MISPKNRPRPPQRLPNQKPADRSRRAGQPKTNYEPKRAARTARADKHAAHSDGNKPARQPARNTDGNGNAHAEHTKPSDPTKPARRNTDSATDQRAPAGDERNRTTEADEENADPQPGTSDARPEHTEANGHEEPAHETRGRPGTHNHAAKQQRQPREKPPAKTNTPNRTTNQNPAPARGHPARKPEADAGQARHSEGTPSPDAVCEGKRKRIPLAQREAVAVTATSAFQACVP